MERTVIRLSRRETVRGLLVTLTVAGGVLSAALLLRPTVGGAGWIAMVAASLLSSWVLLIAPIALVGLRRPRRLVIDSVGIRRDHGGSTPRWQVSWDELAGVQSVRREGPGPMVGTPCPALARSARGSDRALEPGDDTE